MSADPVRQMPNQPDAAVVSGREHYAILDALRIILAFWVVMGHLGVFPLFAGMDQGTMLGRIFVRGWSSLVCGVPAVIGFFVISGFCIHVPYRYDRRLAVGRYYARRYIRILLPVFAFVIIFRLAGNRQPVFGAHSILYQSVLWSLVFEEIYYAVYPAIRWVRKLIGWSVLLPITFAIGALTAATRFNAPDWGDYNPLVAALIPFPVWLLGCLLAEQVDRLPSVESSWTIWKWRFYVWAGSWVCSMLHFHADIRLSQTMLWFGILAYFWIKREIAYARGRAPAAVLISAGAWSYSLYLMHYPASTIFSKLRIPSFGYLVDWCLLMGFTLGVSYLFYVVIEKPSHRLARRAGSPRNRASQVEA